MTPKMPASLKNVKLQLGDGQRLLLALTACAVVAVLAVRFLYLPVWGTITDRQTTLRDLRVKLSDSDVLIGKLAAYESAREKVSRRHSVFLEWSGGHEAMPRILESLSHLAAEQELELTTIQPPSTDQVEPLFLASGVALQETPLHLTLHGKYRLIGQFLESLAEQPFISVVRSLTIIQPDTASMELQADMELGVFWVGEGS